MRQNHATIGTAMELSENSRLSPYEFDLTAESVQTFYTYGQPFAASLPCSGILFVPVVGLEPLNGLAAGGDGTVDAPRMMLPPPR
jgi:hypothetical protein